MFKRTLLALAVSGVAVSANAAVIKTGSTAAVEADVVKSLTANVKNVAGTALGVDQKFNTAADDNCTALATALGGKLYNPTGVNVAGSGAGTDKATFAAAKSSGVSYVEVTGAGTCTAYVAPTLSTTSNKDGVEYSKLEAIEIEPLIVAGLGGYRAEDTITINLAGAKFNLAKTTDPKLSVDRDGIQVVGALAGNADAVTFDLLDISANQVRFTVKTSDPAKVTVRGNALLKLDNLFLDSTGLASDTTVAVSSIAKNTSGTEFDPAAAATVTTLVTQYEAEVTTKLDAKIDVGADRQQFEGSRKDDTLTLKVEEKTNNKRLVPAEATYTIKGDFSWMSDDSIDLNKDGKWTKAELDNAVKYLGGDDTIKSLALNADQNTLTATTTVVNGVDKTPSWQFVVPGFDDGKLQNPMIAVQSFSAALTVTSDKSVGGKTGDMVALSSADAGEWTLNGSVVVVPYMPFGKITQPILRHTNAGTRSGDITVRYMVEDEHNAWQPLSAANIADAEPGVENMLNLVTDALKAEGYDPEQKSFKVALEIVTNVPAKDVFIYAGAKVDVDGQDRIHLGTFKSNH
ncbi:hypothetical protein CKO50_02890 [Pseudoalteromonas sp. HM-SA03]|uniref:hypothetical protein n=1 Tax=Pseudoalteromonas sp. HM-SA03 TaxID=2029678 RepID=UPI000BAE51AB|nr:hypothetical protein [Pseudoalteromonas sp. HM-SA03]PAY02789.1 hypothetical protein CKO50_02890 [Pseudoalteromonas sp. HM-SA03]